MAILSSESYYFYRNFSSPKIKLKTYCELNIWHFKEQGRHTHCKNQNTDARFQSDAVLKYQQGKKLSQSPSLVRGTLKLI